MGRTTSDRSTLSRNDVGILMAITPASDQGFSGGPRDAVLVDVLHGGRLLLGAVACSVAMIRDDGRDLTYIAADCHAAA